jgi:hypothetical protein
MKDFKGLLHPEEARSAVTKGEATLFQQPLEHVSGFKLPLYDE